jgi:hypothetical protein
VSWSLWCSARRKLCARECTRVRAHVSPLSPLHDWRSLYRLKVCFESIGLSKSDDSLSFGTATEEGDARGASKGVGHTVAPARRLAPRPWAQLAWHWLMRSPMTSNPHQMIHLPALTLRCRAVVPRCSAALTSAALARQSSGDARFASYRRASARSACLSVMKAYGLL